MKTVCLLFVLSIGSVCATNTHSQEDGISIAGNDMIVDNVIIEKETNCLFAYDEDEMNADRIVNADYKQDELKQDDKITVTGVVKDKEGIPVIGASVVLEGSKDMGTVTDMNGRFSLQVSKKGILIISYIGYNKQTIPVKGQTTIHVTMEEDSQSLDEVVVVGYGTVKKTDLTGSVAYISAKDFNKGVGHSPDQLLAGKIPGLTVNRSGGDPTAGATMQMRGPSSLTAGTNPFYVIDGVPGASISLISPDDIETINILRDASSAAIYGSRAANGVILVTTRRGKAGKPVVSYSGYAAIETVAGRVNVLKADEYRAFLAKHDMKVAQSEDGYSTDWQKQLLRGAGFSQNHNLSLTGGAQNTKYNASLGYFNDKGIVEKSGYERMVVRTGVDQSALNNRLRLGLTASGSFVKSGHVDYSIFNYAARFLPVSPIKSVDPAYEVYDGYFQVPGRMTYNNPVAILNQRDDNRSRNTFQGTGKISLDIIEGLTFDMLASIQLETYDREYYQKISDISVLGKGSASREFLKNTDKLFETTLNYSKDFAGGHSFKAMAGYSYQNIIGDDGIKGTNNMFTSDALGSNNLSVGNGDKAIHFQDYPAKKESTLISFFGRINYNYDHRYLLTATLRRDGSSKFGTNNKWAMFPSISAAWRISAEKFMENQKVFHDLKIRIGYGESGNQNISPYASLTLYGPQSSQFIYQDEWINSYGVTQNPNPDLKWESTSMANIGIDFSILGGRVSGSLDLYKKETNDMLYTYDVPSPPYQYNKLLANGASMTNRGFEFLVDVVAFDNKVFGWTSSFNIAYNKNKVGSLSSNISNLSINERYEGTMTLEGWTAQTVSLIRPGLPIGTFFTFKHVGYDADQKKTLYENKDGQIVTIDKLKVPDDYQEVGHALPKYTFGWSNTFRYKQWDFNFFVRGVAGNKIFNASRADLSRLTQATSTNISKDAVRDGIMEAPQSSSRWIESGSFLRMDNMTLGYQFNTGKLGLIDKLRIYLTAQNLFVITKYTGIDPEVDLGGLAPGIDNRNYYPKTRSVLVGVNLSF